MRISSFVLVLALLPLGALADPLAESMEPHPVLRDPSPADGHDFPLGIATSGAADPSHALSIAPMSSRRGCTPFNPCAAPVPSQAHVEAPHPSPPG